MKSSKMDYISTAIGTILLVAGLYLVKTVVEPQGILKALPYVCVGIGCGIFGHGMGNILSRKTIMNSPEIQKQIEVDRNDERNIAIANRAKARAYDMMTFVFGALMLSFALMRVDMAALLLLVFAYLFVQFYGVYYRCKYDREM
ncbi:MAG: DUF6442 family protein [Oscillibacter sp.]|nr:DUF6442 family protein [Oscillibacter sp.]